MAVVYVDNSRSLTIGRFPGSCRGIKVQKIQLPAKWGEVRSARLGESSPSLLQLFFLPAGNFGGERSAAAEHYAGEAKCPATSHKPHCHGQRSAAKKGAASQPHDAVFRSGPRREVLVVRQCNSASDGSVRTFPSLSFPVALTSSSAPTPRPRHRQPTTATATLPLPLSLLSASTLPLPLASIDRLPPGNSHRLAPPSHRNATRFCLQLPTFASSASSASHSPVSERLLCDHGRFCKRSQAEQQRQAGAARRGSSRQGATPKTPQSAPRSMKLTHATVISRPAIRQQRFSRK